ncbi:MAG TPA: signal peptidase II [Gemmatimonadales bacterium]|nr:signal peptidase II [Gemmatimonadales bacterium]
MASGTERRRFGLTVAVLVALDLVTKLIAVRSLPPYLGVRLVGDAFQLRLVYNSGAAFGLNLGDHSRWIFMALSVAAIAVLLSMLRTTRPGDWLRLYALAAICAGALGNLIDRVRSARGVVDFLDVGVGALRWPTFNVADMAVTCGAVALALSLWGEGRRGAAPAAEPGTSPPPGV